MLKSDVHAVYRYAWIVIPKNNKSQQSDLDDFLSRLVQGRHL
jgi:hypothetical protein